MSEAALVHVEGQAPTTLVVGVGLVGTSIALALTRAGHVVHVRDQSESHVRVAVGLGAGSEKSPDPSEVGLVVVAVPPDHCAEVVAAMLAEFPQATVTDVASVKSTLLRQVADLAGPAGYQRYVGSHPMAGSHRSGPFAADADLFIDRTWVVTPHPGNPPDRVAQVNDLATTCRAVVETMDPVEHDHAVALVSHLPHLAAVLVAAHLPAAPPQVLRLAGQGLRDVTRIAAGDPYLWEQIINANAAAIRPMLTSFRDAADRMLSALGDQAWLTKILAAGLSGTAMIPGKHGRMMEEWREVVVEIPDQPGALASLFADIERAGVNIEDIAIEHDQVREVGFLTLSVDLLGVGALEDALRAAGWSFGRGKRTDQP